MVSLRLPHESFSSLVKVHSFGFKSEMIVNKLFSIKITDSKGLTLVKLYHPGSSLNFFWDIDNLSNKVITNNDKLWLINPTESIEAILRCLLLHLAIFIQILAIIVEKIPWNCRIELLSHWLLDLEALCLEVHVDVEDVVWRENGLVAIYLYLIRVVLETSDYLPLHVIVRAPWHSSVQIHKFVLYLLEHVVAILAKVD